MLALDLFCGEGGVCLGLQAAGFEVVGVDNNRKCGKYYPGHFIHGNALMPPVDLQDFAFIWASPPCQAFSVASGLAKTRGMVFADLIVPTKLLLKSHRLTCIENVPNAPIRADVILTGPTVGLPLVERRRHFQLSFAAKQPLVRRVARQHWESGKAVIVTKSGGTMNEKIIAWRRAAGKPSQYRAGEMIDAMGITIPMSKNGVGEAIPPAMAEYIGKEAIAFIEGKRMAQTGMDL